MEKKYKKKGDGFEFTPQRTKQEELEVTGVSRSGRVRKKSSKLMDFENLDEIDIRAASKKKEKTENATASGELDFGRPKKDHPPVKEEVFSDEIFNSLLQDLGDTSTHYTKQERMSDDSENEMPAYRQNEDSSIESMGSDMEDMEGNGMDRVENEGFQSIAGDTDFSGGAQHQSLYMMEKSNTKKKLVIKDGKIVGRTKTPKKEKGPPKLTAYMLWAKEMRQELTRSEQHLDFSQTSRKLGELWATVPSHEKYIWKRRAKRAAEGATTKSPGGRMTHHQQPEGKKMKSPAQKKYINKQKEIALPVTNNILSTSSTPEVKSTPKSHSVDQTVYKAVGTTPLDVAAHIRLLGESLTIIGDRLTEHEGQIAVSGSFSLLLDSLLCVMAPLMCLTQQVPQLNVIPQEQLSGLMDNIAYIMPGI